MSEIPARYPIIYLRGFAMSKGEQNDTSADPFAGFNIGSTVYRAAVDKNVRAQKFVFESPVVRLMADFGYANVYRNGLDILSPEWEQVHHENGVDGVLPPASIVVFPYYEVGSTLLGDGQTPKIPDIAKKLGEVICRVRDLVCKGGAITPENFKCYLVAHSMGGLVCRALLQNPICDPHNARQYIDKVFTYGTPHNGIELAGVNVPSWLTALDFSNFNRETMADYLNLNDIYATKKRVDYLPEECFPSSRFFCMIGTNRSDYEAAQGLSRAFVGNGSDGLVRIENASVWGIDANGKDSAPCAKAFAYRSHSGYFGLVNSEETFQNLARFLFGNLRADIWLDIASVTLPEKLAANADKVKALYQFEILASPRGKRWYLTRRTAEEDSVACRTHEELTGKDKTKKSVYLSSVFLANYARVDQKRLSLAYSLTVGVRVPDYEVDNRFWFDQHYEGGYLFRDSYVIEVTPPSEAGEKWEVKYGQQSRDVGEATKSLDIEPVVGTRFLELKIPFGTTKNPGIKGTIRLQISPWNDNP